ncbi:endonuclease [Halobellus sp. Atlit-31R]|nr:endonuclease [Halobellus sp. Atlit-31R]
MRALTLVVLLLVVVSGCLGGTPEPASEPSPEATTAPEPASVALRTGASAPAGVTVSVTEVVDGDTVKIAYANGTRETVRLLGVDTPEVYGENAPDEFEGVPDTAAGETCLGDAGEAASTYAEERLTGESVTLVFDAQSDRRGYYGRLLAYVYVDGESFNYALLREGHARVYDSTFTERERYTAAEAAAREAGRGLWSCAPGGGATSTGTARADGGSTLVVDAVHADADGNDNENLNDEYVVFRNAGDDRLDLSGWTVVDEADHTYTFPTGTSLDPGATLTLRTGSGVDTASTLYWGARGAIWNNGGDVVVVRDAAGATVVRQSY